MRFVALFLSVLAFPFVPGAFAATVETPRAEIYRSGGGGVRVRLDEPVRAPLKGYNVYRDGRYLTTVHLSGGTTNFLIEGGGGAYCVVALAADGDRTRYSECSAERRVAAGRPAPPSRVRATVHSPGVADILWNVSPDHLGIEGYEVRRDGERIAFHKGRSEFESGLSRTRAHDYEVVAVDRDGRRSLAARYRLRPPVGDDAPSTAPPTDPSTAPPAAAPSASPTATSSGSPAASSTASPAVAPSDSPAASPSASPAASPTTPPPADDDDGLAAPPADDGPDTTPVLSPSRPALVEGEGRIEVRVRVPRVGGGTVELSLEGAGDDLDGLEHRFEPATLGAGETEATLQLSLPIAMGPRRPHERALEVRAERGGRSRTAALVVDVEPTDAPDVYLLIGQSNMEGYSQRGTKAAGSGEPDEPHPRIRQLNVTRNSRTAFPSLDDFTRESMNVREDLEYTIAEDPLHDDRGEASEPKSGTSIGPGLTFAKEALERTTAEIYLVPAAWGATGFCANDNGDIAWNATPYAHPGLGGTLLLERALLRVDKTLKDTGGVLRGILWHQGGADSNDMRCAERHADNLEAMVRRLRREIREDPRGSSARGRDAPVPFIVATQSKGSDERGDYGLFNPAKVIVDGVHRNVKELIPHADFVDNDDLVPPAYPCGRSSCVHFGARAMREQGRRFDEALRRVLAR